jgi:hypothetical protein
VLTNSAATRDLPTQLSADHGSFAQRSSRSQQKDVKNTKLIFFMPSGMEWPLNPRESKRYKLPPGRADHLAPGDGLELAAKRVG